MAKATEPRVKNSADGKVTDMDKYVYDIYKN